MQHICFMPFMYRLKHKRTGLADAWYYVYPDSLALLAQS